MFTIFKKAMTALMLMLAGALVVLPSCKCKQDKACHKKEKNDKKVCPGCGRHKCVCFGDRK